MEIALLTLFVLCVVALFIVFWVSLPHDEHHPQFVVSLDPRESLLPLYQSVGELHCLEIVLGIGVVVMVDASEVLVDLACLTWLASMRPNAEGR